MTASFNPKQKAPLYVKKLKVLFYVQKRSLHVLKRNAVT